MLKTIISSLLFFLAFAFPAYMGWLVLIFLLPLYFALPSLNYKQGFLWGVIFYSLHLYPIAQIIYQRGHGDWRMNMYVLLIIFFALHSSLWFWCVQKAGRFVSIYAWPLMTFIYFIWMQTTAFWMFDVREGYPFALPIIPLGQYKNFLFFLPIFGVYGLTMGLICAQWSLIHYIMSYKKRYGISAIFFYSLFVVGFLIPDIAEDQTERVITQHIAYISPTIFDQKQCAHPLDCTQEIVYALQKGIAQCAELTCFVLPEAAFPFIAHPHNYVTWQSVLNDNYQLIIGTHKNSHKTSKNSVAQVDSRRIIQSYDKSHATIFTERIPFYLQGITFFTNLFGGITDRSNTYINGTSQLLYKVHTYYILPVLCSELFFNDFSSLPFKKVPILFLCNDSWFSTNQMKNLMFLYAKIYAMSHKRPIIYVSHFQGALISQTGRATVLSAIAKDPF